MSYDISLSCPTCNQCVCVDNHSEGGTHAVGGIEHADLNITYNYSQFYREHLDKQEGIRWLYGRKAGACLNRLESAVKALGTETSNDYWEATPGNAGHALNILLTWAKANPDAVFEGD